jgi:hypothetical protein
LSFVPLACSFSHFIAPLLFFYFRKKKANANAGIIANNATLPAKGIINSNKSE